VEQFRDEKERVELDQGATMKLATARRIKQHVEAFAEQAGLWIVKPTRKDRTILVYTDENKLVAEGSTWAEVSKQLAAWRDALKYGTNPVKPSSRVRGIRVRELHGAEYEEAARLFSDFTGHDGEPWAKARVALPKVALVVGRCDGVLYTTVRDGQREKYIHRFKAAAAPILAASPDGRQLFLLGGEFRFTERGIVDL
jgi:hypothetical protein